MLPRRKEFMRKDLPGNYARGRGTPEFRENEPLEGSATPAGAKVAPRLTLEDDNNNNHNRSTNNNDDKNAG
jgi:hypothetical protein